MFVEQRGQALRQSSLARRILSGSIDFMTFFIFLLMVTRVYAPFDQSLALIAEVFVSDVSVAWSLYDRHRGITAIERGVTAVS